MTKLSLFFNFIVAFLKRKYKLTVTICCLILISVYSLVYIKGNFIPNQVVEGVVGTYEEKNLPEVVSNLTTTKFVGISENGMPDSSGLVESWEATAEAKEYKFKIKKDQKWSDGSPVKASEISLRVPEVKVEVLDDNSLRFLLADSFSPFPSLLSVAAFKEDSLVGTGPYKVSSIQNDGIFVKKVTLKPISKDMPEVVIKFYPNERIAKNALKLGEIQAILGLNEEDGINMQPYKIFTKTNLNQLVTIFYNTQDPILSDENFRVALSFAAPKISDQLEAQTSIPSNFWAFNSAVRDYLDNPEQAKAYLKKVQNGKDSTITLTATSTLEEVGEKIVSAWNNNGIKAVLRVESGIPQNFQALLITQKIPSDPDQYSLWHSTQSETNISKFSSPRVDKDLEDGRKISDLETRKQKYQDFQKVLLDHAPATFLYFPKYKVIYLKKIEIDLMKILDLQIY